MPTDYYQGLDQEDEGSQSLPESETTLVPKSLVGDDIEVGDIVKLKVEHIYEDEVEVSVVSESSEEESDDESEMTAGPMSEEDQMDAMMKG